LTKRTIIISFINWLYNFKILYI